MLFDKGQENQLTLQQLNQYKCLDREADRVIIRENLQNYRKALG